MFNLFIILILLYLFFYPLVVADDNGKDMFGFVLKFSFFVILLGPIGWIISLWLASKDS